MNLSPLAWGSYLLAVDKFHISEVREGKIGNGTNPAPLISSVNRLYANKWPTLVVPYSWGWKTEQDMFFFKTV